MRTRMKIPVSFARRMTSQSWMPRAALDEHRGMRNDAEKVRARSRSRGGCGPRGLDAASGGRMTAPEEDGASGGLDAPLRSWIAVRKLGYAFLKLKNRPGAERGRRDRKKPAIQGNQPFGKLETRPGSQRRAWEAKKRGGSGKRAAGRAETEKDWLEGRRDAGGPRDGSVPGLRGLPGPDPRFRKAARALGGLL